MSVEIPSVTIWVCHWVEKRKTQEHPRTEGIDPDCGPGKDNKVVC